MKNYKILFIIFFVIVTQNCSSQQNNELSLTYQRQFIRNRHISQSFTYNSQSGVYETKQMYPDGKYQSKIVTVHLTEDNVREIYDLYLKLKPKHLKNCLFAENQLIYSSFVIFKLNNRKQSEDLICNNDEEDESKYKAIEEKLYEFILPTYRLKYPDEFVQK